METQGRHPELSFFPPLKSASSPSELVKDPRTNRWYCFMVEKDFRCTARVLRLPLDETTPEWTVLFAVENVAVAGSNAFFASYGECRQDSEPMLLLIVRERASDRTRLIRIQALFDAVTTTDVLSGGRVLGYSMVRGCPYLAICRSFIVHRYDDHMAISVIDWRKSDTPVWIVRKPPSDDAPTLCMVWENARTLGVYLDNFLYSGVVKRNAKSSTNFLPYVVDGTGKDDEPYIAGPFYHVFRRRGILRATWLWLLVQRAQKSL